MWRGRMWRQEMRIVEGSRVALVPSRYLDAFSSVRRISGYFRFPASGRHVRQRTFSNKKFKGTFSIRWRCRCPFSDCRPRSEDINEKWILRIDDFFQVKILTLERWNSQRAFLNRWLGAICYHFFRFSLGLARHDKMEKTELVWSFLHKRSEFLHKNVRMWGSPL